MNQSNLEMTSHLEEGQVDYSISLASQGPITNHRMLDVKGESS